MPFIDEILKYRSVSVVGTEKNVGKTVTLNYILRRLSQYPCRVAVTSIGIDGEGLDQVTGTAKPDIRITPSTIFVTSEQHFRAKRVVADILDVSQQRTSLGRLVAASAITAGQVLLSGPSDTVSLIRSIADTHRLGADITLVDGALSRMSLASPTVTGAMVLSTGAALSLNIPTLVRHTAFLCRLIDLPKVDDILLKLLSPLSQGVYTVTDDAIVRLDIPSAILFERNKSSLSMYGKRLYVSGVVTDKLLSYIRLQKWCKGYEIIVQDFTKLFVSPDILTAYIGRGGTVKVLYKSNLLGVTVNPVSPKGYSLDSHRLCDELSSALHRQVFDVMTL